MLEFIKMFGMGILYTILSPLILLFFLVFVVYSVFNYLVCEVIYLGGFFMGRKFEEETKLDRELKKIKKEREAQKEMMRNEALNVNNDIGGDFNV